MSKSRVFTGKELIKILYQFGVGLLYKILKDCELTITEIENL